MQKKSTYSCWMKTENVSSYVRDDVLPLIVKGEWRYIAGGPPSLLYHLMYNGEIIPIRLKIDEETRRIIREYFDSWCLVKSLGMLVRVLDGFHGSSSLPTDDSQINDDVVLLIKNGGVTISGILYGVRLEFPWGGVLVDHAFQVIRFRVSTLSPTQKNLSDWLLGKYKGYEYRFSYNGDGAQQEQMVF